MNQKSNAPSTSAPMIDVVAQQGVIVTVDRLQAVRLGVPVGGLEGKDWSVVYTLDSRERIAAQFAESAAHPNAIPLEMRDFSGALLKVTAVTERLDLDGYGSCLRLYKWPAGGALDDVAKLSEENEILSGIVAASDDAGWCMEWADPIDLSAPEPEIVRQVFENGPRWRFCNDAMARLYRTPAGEDFNARPVAEIFPRTPENEEFIRRLIHADFDLNGTPSRDLRYDGVFIDVENDVRGHIRCNKLIRMWGTVRDISKHRRRENELRDEIDALQAILGALPHPVLAADREGSLLYVNLAAEELFEKNLEALTQRNLSEVLDLNVPLRKLLKEAQSNVPGATRALFTASVLRLDSPISFEGTARVIDVRGTECLVLSLCHCLCTARSRGADLKAAGTA